MAGIEAPDSGRVAPTPPGPTASRGGGRLSGGQAARTALAAILLSGFDVFLLDEPTNDLGFAGLDRLERLLADLRGPNAEGGLDGGLVVVSHDRAFLEVTVDRVVELDEHSRTATELGGGWLAYMEARVTARRHAEEDHAEYRTPRTGLLERALDRYDGTLRVVTHDRRLLAGLPTTPTIELGRPGSWPPRGQPG